MTRDQLEHAIRAASAIAGVEHLVIFGSQAILGAYPDAHALLRQSVEVDLCPLEEPHKVEAIEAVLGELSPFNATHGFYVHAIPIDEAVKLPTGWRNRLIPLGNENTERRTGWCLEPHDLAASKLAAFREKDRDYVRVLINEKFVRPDVLVDRLHTMPMSTTAIERCVAWVTFTIADR